MTADLRLELDRSARLRTGAGGGLLVGGQPTRALRLNPAGVHAVQSWRTGAPVVGARQLALARRLHDAGLAVLRSSSTAHVVDDVTVVVPTRDRAADLDRCLAEIGACAEVLVVDDASLNQAAVHAVAARYGARVLVRARNGGPAAARNTGLAQVRTALVAFVDSDVLLPAGWLEGLLPSLLEGVAVVGPRIVGAGGPGALAHYETRSGALDLGAHAGPVRPGARVGHLPAAVLLCRTSAVAGGFDETLRVAEDVDLLWRLGAGTVRYEPSVVVEHVTRPDLRSFLGQRHGYGRGAAALDVRHPGAVAPTVINRWALPALAALVARRPVLAAGLVALTALDRRRRLPSGPGRDLESARLAGLGFGWTLAGLAEAGARVWLPVLLPASLVSRRARRLTLAAVTVRLTRQVRSDRPTLDPVRWAALRVADDLAYGSGVWRGAVERHRPAVVGPRIT